MKKTIAMLLIVIISCSVVCLSFGEEEKKSGGFLDSFGSFFSDTWNGVTNWFESAWEDTAQWITGAWGEASGWIEQAWSDSAVWVRDIWGDASGWVSDTVSTWWTDTFATVTENDQNMWSWIKENADVLKAQGGDMLESAKAVISSVGDNCGDQVRETVFVILAKLGINETDSGKVWDTICAYAEQKGISPVAAARLSIPYLLQLYADSAEQANGSVPAVAVAQYLTGIIEKLGISDNAAAEELVSQLKDTLAGI